MRRINLALISPNQNAYSETFIEAHKKYLNANVKYLYGYLSHFLTDDWLPLMTEDTGALVKLNLPNLIRKFLTRKLFPNRLNFHERNLLKYLKENNIEVVFAEYGITGASVRRVCHQLNCPLIVYFLGLDAYVKDIIGHYHSSYQKLFREAYAIVTVSQNMKRQLIRLGCPPEKITINYCGPNSSFFEVNNSYNTKTLIAVGRFVAKKSPQSTIRAFSKAIKFHPDAKLWMAGDGNLLNECKDLVNSLGINDNVNFPGKVTQDDCRKFYSQGIAFVQHSVIADNGDSEGTPVAVLEACASGLAVIATRHAGIPEVIAEGETGLLVDEHDVDGMAKCMIRILDDPGLARKLGEAGRQKVKEQFTMEKHINILNDLIAQSLSPENTGLKIIEENDPFISASKLSF